MSNYFNKPNPLALAIQGAKKLVTKVAQKTSGQGPTRGETIKYVKPKLTNLEGEKKKAALKAKSDVQKSFAPLNEKLRNQTVDLRQTLQKIRKEPITPSGISKGSNLTPGIYDAKKVEKRNEGSQKLFEAAKGRKFNKGGRVGRKFGGGADLGMQSVEILLQRLNAEGNARGEVRIIEPGLIIRESCRRN